MHHVVIGAGPAGVAACTTLRELDPAARITLVGEEPEPPYSRMAIPYLLVEHIGEDGTYLRQDADFYAKHLVEVVQDRVTRVSPGEQRLTLAGGDALDYDRLLIASGASPVRPPIPGLDLPGVHTCWTLADARAIAARAAPGTPVVLIGAGFIGSIILEALAKRGVQLTVVEREDRMVPRMMDEVAGGLLKEWCEAQGVRVLTNTGVTGIARDGDQLAVSLDSGEELAAGLVISATGVRSNTGFLEGSGITVEQGIVVNAYLQSSEPDIYAAGDVAQGAEYGTGLSAVQAIQPTAVEHGRIAANNMVRGNRLRHGGSVNMNVLDTLGLISASFGQWQGVAGGDSAELLDRNMPRYLKLQFDGERLVGACSLGHTQHIGVLRGLIRSGRPLGVWKARLMKEPTRLMEAYLGAVQGAA